MTEGSRKRNYQVELDSLTDGINRILVDNTELLIVVTGKLIRVYLNHCPHQGKQLYLGGEAFDPTLEQLKCQAHGAIFELTSGQCVSGPCLGDSLLPLETSLTATHLTINT